MSVPPNVMQQQVTQQLLTGNWVEMGGGTSQPTVLQVQQGICAAFNQSPFMSHNQFVLEPTDTSLRMVVKMQPHMIGNMAYGILHGGVAASMLDSLGGAACMVQIYQQNDLPWEERTKKVVRLCTVDMRIDYINAGRGEFFVGTADIIRLGKKNATVRCDMTNDKGVLIATATIVYGY